MNSEQTRLIAGAAKRRLGIFFKLASICGLIVLLLIPLQMTRGVLKERREFQAAATEEIAGTWGRDQAVTGPVLAIPYVYRSSVGRVKGANTSAVREELVAAVAYFLPEVMEVPAEVEPDIRHRGIYDTVVYTSRMTLTGHFVPDFATAGIEAERIDWEKARLFVGVSDLRGLRSVEVRSDGVITSFDASDGSMGAFLPLSATAAKASAGARLAFDIGMVVQGTERFTIVPVGKTSNVTLKSSWQDPSFYGSSLPIARQVSHEGFRAEWQSTHFSRGFPQSWTSRYTDAAAIALKMAGSGFGVRFAQPVEGYGMVARAQKYGMLILVLVFAVFFLFEVTANLRIHPFQYALVGAALCLFFVGFLALSEFLAVGFAYAIAAGACTLIISLYAWSFLQVGWRTLLIAGGLSGTYGYLYFVLKSQDFALIAGAAALFACLALVMFCTRRINWYALDMSETRPAIPSP